MMNKKITKRVAVILTVVSLAAFPIFAKDGGRNRRNRPLPTSFLTQEQAAIAGDWIYYDNNYFVKIDLDRDGDMEIKLREGNQTETEWEGYWTATANQITFNVVKKEVKDYASATQRRTTERLAETWTINYTVGANGALTLTCGNLPSQVANGTAYQREW